MSLKNPMSTYNPVLSAFFSVPSMISPTNGRKTTTRNSTLKCALPSPGYTVPPSMLTISYSVITRPRSLMTLSMYSDSIS